jgi:hypothetical protein
LFARSQHGDRQILIILWMMDIVLRSLKHWLRRLLGLTETHMQIGVVFTRGRSTSIQTQ